MLMRSLCMISRSPMKARAARSASPVSGAWACALKLLANASPPATGAGTPEGPTGSSSPWSGMRSRSSLGSAARS